MDPSKSSATIISSERRLEDGTKIYPRDKSQENDPAKKLKAKKDGGPWGVLEVRRLRYGCSVSIKSEAEKPTALAAPAAPAELARQAQLRAVEFGCSEASHCFGNWHRYQC